MKDDFGVFVEEGRKLNYWGSFEDEEKAKSVAQAGANKTGAEAYVYRFPDCSRVATLVPEK
jgi:hypothetical protein